ncbi:MAG: polysaccharide export protein [Defluviicoccus sp.]|nr:MAG: polysaccharide export protein [Defluviicoccus sp.]
MSRREALRSGGVGLLIGVPLVLAGCSASTPSATSDMTESALPESKDISGYKLGPGDRIRLTVFGHEDLSGEFEVDGSGNVSLPLIRDIKAQGLTVRELEQEVASRLSPDYLKNPSVSVEVLNYRPFYIYGEVNKPGSYPFVNGMTVVNAVALAGGFTYRARTGRVRIIRANDPTRTPIDADKDTAVLPGDVIEVPERYF